METPKSCPRGMTSKSQQCHFITLTWMAKLFTPHTRMSLNLKLLLIFYSLLWDPVKHLPICKRSRNINVSVIKTKLYNNDSWEH